MTPEVSAMSTAYIAAATIWMAASGFAAEHPTTPIVVFDQAGVGEPALRKATQTGREIFHSAGAQTEWTVCRVSDPDEHCHLPAAKDYIQVLVRPNGTGLQK